MGIRVPATQGFPKRGIAARDQPLPSLTAISDFLRWDNALNSVWGNTRGQLAENGSCALLDLAYRVPIEAVLGLIKLEAPAVGPAAIGVDGINASAAAALHSLRNPGRCYSRRCEVIGMQAHLRQAAFARWTFV